MKRPQGGWWRSKVLREQGDGRVTSVKVKQGVGVVEQAALFNESSNHALQRTRGARPMKRGALARAAERER